jgi:hypothetical protein
VKYLLHRRPSPALVIACMALFVSLGGVSYGVATGFIDSREIANNTIRSKDVRNGTILTQDIRNNEVRGFDIRNSSLQGRDVAFNTLTGADIEESSLGKVPSAATADSAATLASLKTFPRTVLAEGAPPTTLLTHGPLTLTAACVDVAGDTVLQLLASSTEAGSAGSGQPSIGATPAVVASLSDSAGGTATAEARALFASAPSGKALTGDFGLIADASGAGSCAYNGHAVLEG